MSAIVWPLLIYWVVLFVACYTVCEVGQDQFYDEVTPRVGLKVGGGSLILAGLATWLRPSLLCGSPLHHDGTIVRVAIVVKGHAGRVLLLLFALDVHGDALLDLLIEMNVLPLDAG